MLFKGLLSIFLSLFMTWGVWAPESLEIENVPQRTKGEIRAISFNVRCKDDIYGSVANRSQLVVSALRQYAPDSFGVQEATEQWMDIFVRELGGEYAFVGVSRDESDGSEYSAVFYLKEKFELKDSGTIWLSETPDEAGTKLPLSSYPRIATWVTLEEKESGKIYSHINTHLDHVLETVREQQVAVLGEKVNELKEQGTVVCTGDFNSKEGAKAYTKMTTFLSDSKYLAKQSDEGATFHNYGRNIFAKKPIDFAFVSNDVIVSVYKIIDEQIGGMFLSDHSGICIDFSF